MTVAFDEDVVLAKASNIRKCMATIRELHGPDRPDVPDWIRLDVTVLARPSRLWS